MNPFEFSIPQNIIVGAGTLAKLPECAKKMGGTHAMILSGPTLKKMGVVDKAADSLKAAGIAADIFTDIEANPSVTTVEKATESYLASGADFLVALGGGSPMDVAKAVGVTAKYTQSAGKNCPADCHSDDCGNRLRGDRIFRDHRPQQRLQADRIQL